MELKPCPFCGASLIKREGRERGGDYYTYYEHPYNDCVIENVTVEDYQVSAWNRRAKPNMVEIDQFSRVGEGEKE